MATVVEAVGMSKNARKSPAKAKTARSATAWLMASKSASLKGVRLSVVTASLSETHTPVTTRRGDSQNRLPSGDPAAQFVREIQQERQREFALLRSRAVRVQ